MLSLTLNFPRDKVISPIVCENLSELDYQIMVITQDIENRFYINRSIDEKGVRLTSVPLLEPVQTRGLHNGFEAVNGSKTAVINQPQNNHTTTNITYLYMSFLNIDRKNFSK